MDASSASTNLKFKTALVSIQVLKYKLQGLSKNSQNKTTGVLSNFEFSLILKKDAYDVLFCGHRLEYCFTLRGTNSKTTHLLKLS